MTTRVNYPTTQTRLRANKKCPARVLVVTCAPGKRNQTKWILPHKPNGLQIPGQALVRPNATDAEIAAAISIQRRLLTCEA